MAIGAILAFAVRSSPSYFSFQVAGWVIMLTGVAGLCIPRRGYGWLRRRVVLSWTRPRRSLMDVAEPRHPPRVMLPGLSGPVSGDQPTRPDMPVTEAPDWVTAGSAESHGETVEEYIEE
jgi:hypothetical protein